MINFDAFRGTLEKTNSNNNKIFALKFTFHTPLYVMTGLDLSATTAEKVVNLQV